MKPNLLRPQKEFVIETFSEFEQRYVGFGKAIYSKIKKDMPSIFNGLVFYKRVDFQLEDSYAEYVSDIYSFFIQLDPDIEVIILGNGKDHIEIGTWSSNEYDEAINYIKSTLIQ